MAPTLSDKTTLTTSLFNHILTRTLSSISSRSASDTEKPPSLASVFATILRGTSSVSRRALKSALTSPPPIPNTSDSLYHPIFLSAADSHLNKRQQPVLAIPTTYAGLNAGPAPGALVGIVLGAIAGFLLILYVVLSALRLSGYTRETVQVEEIHRHRHSHSRARSRMAEVRTVREREERVVVEERLEPESVIVDEEPEDVVEVIEEHSPERPVRKESRRSGFRTIDPAEFGGGRAPTRRVSRR